MPEYGDASRAKLATVHPALADVMFEVIKCTDITIVHGWRDKATQNSFYPAFSKTPWPLSNHNVLFDRATDLLVRAPDYEPSDELVPRSTAIDFAPWYPLRPHIRWKNERDFIYAAGMIVHAGHQMGVPLRWGGDWNGNRSVADEDFLDLGHVEMILDDAQDPIVTID